jgi:transcriptional regulator with XRE-family HTH domain
MTAKPPKASDTQAWDVEVGRRIRARRLECGMSQTALGESLGLTFQQIQKYEKGMNRVSAGRLKQISGLLQVPMAFFYDSDDDKQTNEAAAPSRLFDLLSRRDTLRLVAAFDRVTSAGMRRSLVELVEKIAPPKAVPPKKVIAGRLVLTREEALTRLPPASVRWARGGRCVRR